MPVPVWKTELKKITPEVYAYIQGGGPGVDNNGVSNAGLILGGDNAVVVDTLQAPIPAKAFLSEIGKVTKKPIKKVINTHQHGDHWSGNQFFPQTAEFIATDASRDLILDQAKGLKPVWPAAPGLSVGNEPRVAVAPEVTFAGRLTVYEGPFRIELHTVEPAHSPGDILVYLPSQKILFAGDTCFFYVAPHFWTGSALGNLHVFDWIEDHDIDWIVPGHGPLGTKVDMRINRGYVEKLRHEAKLRWDKGMSAVDAAASIDMGEYKDWPEARDRLIGNTMRCYKEFEGRPYETILPAERQAALKAYLQKIGR